MKKSLFFLAMALFLLLSFSALSEEGGGVSRVLLIGCDRFLSQSDTYPSSFQNVSKMEQVLKGSRTQPVMVCAKPEGISSLEEIQKLIRTTFQGAGEQDLNYFYLSTHGLWQEGEPNYGMTFLLSDGVRESGITAGQLYDCLKDIPGKKILILDACHSGAVIGKGEHTSFDNVFCSPDFRVICSSGAAEESWFWSGRSTEYGQIDGGGYFSDVMAMGMSMSTGYAADRNHDGEITLSEIKAYMLSMHGASTVRTYPEESDDSLFSYDMSPPVRRTCPIANIYFEESILSGDHSEISFSFTVYETVRMAYQMVDLVNGRWDFEHARLVYDQGEPFGPYGDAEGYLSPGLKERTLQLYADTDRSGYVLLQMVVTYGETVSVLASRVICIPPDQGDPRLRVLVRPVTRFYTGEELGVIIEHQTPMEYTVILVSEETGEKKRLTPRLLSRPEQVQPSASTFFWNGVPLQGDEMRNGQYHLHITSSVNGSLYETDSDVFTLLWQEE